MHTCTAYGTEWARNWEDALNDATASKSLKTQRQEIDDKKKHTCEVLIWFEVSSRPSITIFLLIKDLQNGREPLTCKYMWTHTQISISNCFPRRWHSVRMQRAPLSIIGMAAG